MVPALEGNSVVANPGDDNLATFIHVREGGYSCLLAAHPSELLALFSSGTLVPVRGPGGGAAAAALPIVGDLTHIL